MAQLIFDVVSRYGPLVALVFQARLLSRFVDARNRDYPLAIVFTSVLFFLTLAVYLFANFAQYLPQDSSRNFRRTFLYSYLTFDLLTHLLLLALMLQLIRKTLRSLELNTRIIYILAALSVLIGVGSYAAFGAKPNSLVLLKTRQVVSFWMALLNLYWWTLLLRRRQLDRRVMLLSAGIGLLLTGQVIGDGVNTFTPGNLLLALIAAIVMYATHFACLHTWYRGFSPALAIEAGPATVKTTVSL